MPPPTALLDANVLYPAGLRDLLLRLADRYLYAPLWSADIHEEWMRNLLADRPDIPASALERTRAIMDEHFPGAVVTGYTALAASLDLPDPGDTHVLAAAIEGEANIIVTRNLRHFPSERLAHGRSGPPRGLVKPAAIAGRAHGCARTPGPDTNGGSPSPASRFHLTGPGEHRVAIIRR